jgi:hypothetical protein
MRLPSKISSHTKKNFVDISKQDLDLGLLLFFLNHVSFSCFILDCAIGQTQFLQVFLRFIHQIVASIAYSGLESWFGS